jgi:hypothetical protein
MISDYEKRTKLLGEDIVNKIFDFLGFWALWRLVISRTKEFEEFKFMFSINSYSITLFCKALYKEKIIVVDDIFITN